MPTIWVAHEPRGANINLQPLYEYAKANNAEVKFIFSKGFNVSMHGHEAAGTAATFATYFNFDKDRLIVAGGDPLAGIIAAIALTHEAIATDSKSFGSLRYVRERDHTGERTIPQYIPIEIPTGV